MPRSQIGKALKAESLSEQVLGLLQGHIAAGHLKPGERILEKELARRLGVSRTPVREALLKLEAKGLIQCNSRRSYNVRALGVVDIREIYEALAILESAIVDSVAADITAQQIHLLKEFNRRMERAARRGDLRAFGRWNRKFHDLFLSKLKNRTLSELCDQVRRQLYTFPVRRKSLAEWLMKSVNEHREIIKFAEAKDGRGLSGYFRNVHWCYSANARYIEDAFDWKGEAAIHL